MTINQNSAVRVDRRGALRRIGFAVSLLLAMVAIEGVWGSISAAHAQPAIPSFNGRQLIVDGKPFLILGGEISNSSSGSRAFMAPRWERLRAMHLNTVLMPVSWELIEPNEGQFDFRLVDGLLADARAADLRIVILWFGSWKNSQSSYVPAWVKRDYIRFPRARTQDGRALELLTPFSQANADADARAFAALMAHLAVSDTARTCIMVQVENELGMVPDARDYSKEAESAWNKSVPGKSPDAGGDWTSVYGDLAASAFMADGFSKYIEDVARAGKRNYPLPLYVNASLPRPDARAGQDYPSGAPLPDVAQIWRKNAPSVDLLTPDIYALNFTDWAARYKRINALFVPEANWAGAKDGPANALVAFGAYEAIGYSPFAIDNVDDAGAKEIGALYGMIDGIAPLITERQGTDKIAGFRPVISFDGKPDLSSQKMTMGKHVITAHFVDPWTPQEEHEPENRGAMVLMLGPDTYLVAGRGVTFTFAPADGHGSDGIEAIDEGEYLNGIWASTRRLNGDDSYAGRHVRLPFDRFATQRVVLYHYQ
ncbi:DUF5597 domain-containing protein [Asticcacaulis sp. 201]|uniref:DUF5597 domain-containing protein n=1 Tax=Asticcacaulis sp. 201 TaxID=3028787 RepID=UPI002916EEEE|nr:DUF5597 domain-containing protein [Asticcacaulis sp. 201]MDV6329900.1 DUF5597 domain-containing protein [Asticcacaulis sp. 201]